MMTRLRLVSLWALCAAGCSSAAASTNDAGVGGNLPPGTGGIGVSAYQSGSRIKMKIYSTADGARRFNNWYDSLRGFDCGAFGVAADGKRRCLPLFTARFDTTTTSARFSDAACSVPLANWSTCNANPTAVEQSIAPTPSSCTGSTYHYFAVGPVYAGTLYGKSGNSCIQMAAGATDKFFTIGTEIPPTEFAEITETIE